MPPLAPYNRMQTWLAGRTNVPTTLGSRQLAMLPEFPAAAKSHAFFSAKVSEANILEGLRAEVDKYIAGDIDFATARMRMKTFLTREGFSANDLGWTDKPPAGISPEDWAAHKQITNLASTRRLDLILNQQARTAWAVGRHEVATDPDILDRWPNYTYIARQDGNERPDHGALDGIVLPKTDPFWSSHMPPWDYNCRCDVEDTDEPANGTQTPDGRVLNPATGQVVDTTLANESGYTFDIDAALSTNPDDYDWSTITDGALRDHYQEQSPSA